MTTAIADKSGTMAFTSGELAEKLGARLVGASDVSLTGLSAIQDARPGDLTFISNRDYSDQWAKCRAAAAVVVEGVEIATDARPLLYVRDINYAMMPLLELFKQPEDAPEVGVHPTAFVHPSATVGRMARIGPHVSVGANVVLGDGVVLHSGVALYSGVQVGAGSVLHANTVVRERCIIGRGVILNSNVSIGADGFGYRPAADGRGLQKMPHIGTVVIEDGVEIGANSCVDRAKFGVTLIGAGTKIDNLVQIGHNCRVGRCCLVAGQAGLAGSVTVGDGVQMGGQAGVIDHLKVGAGARMGARAVALQDVPAGALVTGYPADDGRSVLKQWAALRQLPAMLRELKRLTRETRLEATEKGD